MITIKDKDDAISHINNLFPIGQDPEWDREWAKSMRDECEELWIHYFFKQIDKIQPIPEELEIREFYK